MTVYAIVTGARLVVVEALDPEGSHKVESIALVRVMMCDSVSGPSGWMNVLRSTFRPNLKMFLAEGAHFAQIERFGQSRRAGRFWSRLNGSFIFELGRAVGLDLQWFWAKRRRGAT